MNKNIFTKILAIIGTLLVWFPILAPVVFSALLTARSHIFRFDYLMPAELSLFALLGAILLVWASQRARSRRGLIAWSIGAAVFLLVASQLLAVATGLASGVTEPTGWQWAVVLGMIIGYSLALVATGIGGLLLLYDLFAHPNSTLPR
jgi:hypothetical protein